MRRWECSDNHFGWCGDYKLISIHPPRVNSTVVNDLTNPVITEDADARLLTRSLKSELKIMNLHLALLSDNDYDKTDVEV